MYTTVVLKTTHVEVLIRNKSSYKFPGEREWDRNGFGAMYLFVGLIRK